MGHGETPYLTIPELNPFRDSFQWLHALSTPLHYRNLHVSQMAVCSQFSILSQLILKLLFPKNVFLQHAKINNSIFTISRMFL